MATKASPVSWDREVDLLVFGAGMGGMAAALVAKCEGLEVLVCEKTAQVGGTTATAGGTTWIPGNSQGQKGLHPDNIAAGRTYMDAEIGPDPSPLREAFLTTGAEAVDYFERNTEVRFSYEAPGFARGLQITLAAVSLLLLWAGAAAWIDRRHGATLRQG